ncbi:hypothetical protein LguiB_004168 [Lonicera macranthoides]
MEVVAPVSRFHSKAITLNGVFYLIECVSNKMEIIVSFNLHDEVFGQMTVPDSCGVCKYPNGMRESRDLKTPSRDFILEFAIPGPKNSGLLHCRLCGELFYHGNITGLNIHLAHRNTRSPPCPYVSNDIGEQMRIHLQVLNENLLKRQQLRHRKSRASTCACASVDIFMGRIRNKFRVCVFTDIFMGKIRKRFRVLIEKLMIKKRGQREKVAVHIRLPPPQHEDDEFYDNEFYDDEFDDFD